jgi:hypothetical protein
MEKYNLDNIDNLSDEDFKNSLNELIPNWFIEMCDSYSDDYEYLNRNWSCICQVGGVKKGKIVLVSEIDFNDTTERGVLIRNVSEFLTKNGFSVRRKSEFVICSTCLQAIPDFGMWQYLKKNSAPVPDEWSCKCKDC